MQTISERLEIVLALDLSRIVGTRTRALVAKLAEQAQTEPQAGSG